MIRHFKLLLLLGTITSPSCDGHRIVSDNSGAMSPILKPGTKYLVSYSAYKNSVPKRWDIILFHPFGDPQSLYIMRVVGLPQETINIVSNRITINGETLVTPSKLGQILYQPPRTLSTNQDLKMPFQIPPGSYYVLGDNPVAANDSRYIGPIGAKDIIGRVEE